MSKNVKNIPDDEKEVKASGKRLAVSIAVLVLVVYALLVLSVAWFSHASLITANANFLSVIGVTSKDYELYTWVGESETSGAWTPIEQIDFTDGVPNETRRYLVVSDTKYSNLKFTFSSVNELFDFVYMDTVSYGNDKVTVDESTGSVAYNYGSDSTDYFSYADKTDDTKLSDNTYTLSTQGNVNATVFDIYVSKDACNAFSNIGFSGTVKLD